MAFGALWVGNKLTDCIGRAASSERRATVGHLSGEADMVPLANRRWRPNVRQNLGRDLVASQVSIVRGATTAAGMLGGVAAPCISRAADRPLITHGLQSGDVSLDSAVVWA